MLKVLQFTDMHLFTDTSQTLFDINTYDSFAKLVQAAKEDIEDSNLILLTGDLIQDDKPSSYNKVLELVKPISKPIYWIPGNHDIPEISDMFKGDNIYSDKVIHQAPWHFILLDSTVYEKGYGELSEDAYAWLDMQLSLIPSNEFVIIALHHHPIKTQSPWMDEVMLKQPEQLLNRVKQHSVIKGVLWGHVHQAYEEDYYQSKLLAAPSTCVQYVPAAQEFTKDTLGPAYRVLKLSPEGQITTHINYL